MACAHMARHKLIQDMSRGKVTSETGSRDILSVAQVSGVNAASSELGGNSFMTLLSVCVEELSVEDLGKWEAWRSLGEVGGATDEWIGKGKEVLVCFQLLPLKSWIVAFSCRLPSASRPSHAQRRFIQPGAT